MINDKYVTDDHYICSENFNSNLKRLQSTLRGRLVMLNIFQNLINKNHRPMTLENMGINSNNEKEIADFLVENTKYIENELRPKIDELRHKIDEMIMLNGSDSLKSRFRKIFNKGK